MRFGIGILKLPDGPRDTDAVASPADPSRPGVNKGVETVEDPVTGMVAKDIVDRLTPLVAPEDVPQVGLIVGETISQVTMHHSGPLPQASDLAAYNAVNPGFAERIVRMAEREQERRHALPGEFLKREYKLKSRGQHYALLLAALILMFAAYLAYLGDSDMAGKVAIGTLIGIVGIFVSGRAIDAFAENRGKADADEGAGT